MATYPLNSMICDDGKSTNIKNITFFEYFLNLSLNDDKQKHFKLCANIDSSDNVSMWSIGFDTVKSVRIYLSNMEWIFDKETKWTFGEPNDRLNLEVPKVFTTTSILYLFRGIAMKNITYHDNFDIKKYEKYKFDKPSANINVLHLQFILFMSRIDLDSYIKKFDNNYNNDDNTVYNDEYFVNLIESKSKIGIKEGVEIFKNFVVIYHYEAYIILSCDKPNYVIQLKGYFTTLIKMAKFFVRIKL
jgi:hypothetical protein